MFTGRAQQVPYDKSTLDQVAVLHCANINQGFLSSLGPRFLSLLYWAIDEDESSVLIVESVGNKVIGFVSGGQGLRPLYRRMLSRWPSLLIAMLPFALRPWKLIGILEIMRHSFKGVSSTELPAHELLSIAIDREHRGKGIADQLYHSLEAHFRKQKVEAFKIVVGEKLAAAHKFYRRMGAQPRTSIEIHSGDRSVVYIQELN